MIVMASWRKSVLHETNRACNRMSLKINIKKNLPKVFTRWKTESGLKWRGGGGGWKEDSEWVKCMKVGLSECRLKRDKVKASREGEGIKCGVL